MKLKLTIVQIKYVQIKYVETILHCIFLHSILLFLVMADKMGLRNNYFSTLSQIPLTRNSVEKHYFLTGISTPPVRYLVMARFLT